MKTPLYFNYSGARRDLLDRAILSYQNQASHLLDIRVNYSVEPRPFTKCLNEILRACDKEKYFFFAHYDSELESAIPIEYMLDAVEKNTAIVSWTKITDLLMLVDVEKIKSVGGWDETFKNSYMELDLINRFVAVGFELKVLNDIEAGNGVLHNDASVLRSNVQKENIAYVYKDSMLADAKEYYTRYGLGESDPTYLDLIKHTKLHFGA